jgi:ATP-binding cassette subfamily B protein
MRAPQPQPQAPVGLRKYLRLLRYLLPHWRGLLGVVSTMLLASAIALLEPWPLKILVDNVLGHKSRPAWLGVLPGAEHQKGLLLWVVIATVSIFVIATLVSMFNSLASTYLSQRMTYRLGADVFMHLQRLSPLYHYRHPAGDTIARVTGDPSCVSILVMDTLVPLAHSAVTVVAMFVIMWQLEPTLSLMALGVAPFLAIGMRIFAKPMKQRNRRRRDLEGGMMTVVERTMGAIPVVQAFTREKFEHQRFVETADETLVAYRDSIVMSMAFKLFIGLATTIGTAAIMYAGALYVIEGKLTIGSVLVFMAYLGMLYDPLHAMTYSSSTVQYATAQADRVMEIMDTVPDVQDSPDAVEVDLRGRVIYENVTFAYDQGSRVINGVSLEVQPGEVLAIVGPTGAGKTTLANMLVRFFDPDTGRITIDGRDIRDIKLQSLRQQIALVLQDPFIFPISVAENIAYGRPEASPEEIMAAARAANADAFIRRLPEGYDTVVGERGGTLSGGEKQRLSIARAFLKDAPILILDEPTSALDARTEAALLEALERLMSGRVTLIIAHRLSTIRKADRIAVLEHGYIIERGNHAELVASDGLYSSLYRQQMEIADHDTAAEPLVLASTAQGATSPPLTSNGSGSAGNGAGANGGNGRARESANGSTDLSEHVAGAGLSTDDQT